MRHLAGYTLSEQKLAGVSPAEISVFAKSVCV